MAVSVGLCRCSCRHLPCHATFLGTHACGIETEATLTVCSITEKKGTHESFGLYWTVIGNYRYSFDWLCRHAKASHDAWCSSHWLPISYAINVVMFFLLFGEPLSQLSQTKLPPLVDAQDGNAILANLKSILILGVGASIGVGACSFAAVRFGSFLFTSDAAVQAMAKAASPAVFYAVSTAILAVTVDGAMLASRDFSFMLFMGLIDKYITTVHTQLVQFHYYNLWDIYISIGELYSGSNCYESHWEKETLVEPFNKQKNGTIQCNNLMTILL